MRGEERTIQRQGIEFETLLYQSPEIAQLYTRLLSVNRTVRVKYDPGNLSVVYVLNPTSTFTSTKDHSESQGSCESGNWLRVPALDQNYTSNLSLWKHRLIRRYVLQEKKRVDLTALAQAKQSIQELVQQEFQLTRSQIKAPGPGQNRKTAARFLEIGTGPVNAGSPFKPDSSSKVSTIAGSEPAYSITAKDQLTDSATQNDAYHQATTIDASKQAEPLNFRPQTKPKQKEREEEEIKPSEWGGDYGLPRPSSRL